MKIHKGERAYQITISICVGVLSLISLIPLLYVLGLSITSEAEYAQSGGMLLFPTHPTLQGYATILSNKGTFFNALGVSIFRTIVGTVLTLVFTIITGFVLSRTDMPGYKFFQYVVLITIFFGAGLIPNFLVVKQTGLLNTIGALIIPGLVDSWSALIFKQFFEDIPKSMEEASSLDGCSITRYLVSIALPMSLPVIATITLFTAVAHWNSWYDAMVYLINNPKLYPLSLIVANMFNSSTVTLASGDSISQAMQQNQYSQVSPLSLKMALTVVLTVPILCVYPFLQKYFTKGVFIGAVKG